MKENILYRIVEEKRKEVAELKRRLEKDPSMFGAENMNRKCFSLKERLLSEGNTGIIAEFKRRSPSKGWFKPAGQSVEPVIRAYETFGAAGASVLTDDQFFGGSIDDLLKARSTTSIPLLRKDFIIDELQVQEVKACGADVILLIAAILSPQRVKELAAVVKEYGMEVLLEIHKEEELQHICDEVDIVGINNRNLETFEVDINTSIQLMPKIPNDKIVISESGISIVETIQQLKEHGFKGFLIGETFMKQDDPAKAFKDFIHSLKATA